MLPASLKASLALHIAFQLLLLTAVGHAANSRQLTESLVTQSCPPANQCKFNVLAIGDSLTRGAVPLENTAHPYTIKLAELLRQKFSSRAVPDVTTAGYDYMGVFQKAKAADGSTLDVTFVPFVKQQLQQAAQQGIHYQWIIIFAGINDLGAGNYTAAAIMPKLVETYKLALGTGAHVIAVLPWPNRFVTRDSKNEQERLKLITEIRTYVNSQPQATDSGRPRVYLQDEPADWFDFWSIPEGRVKKMQDDQLHLTPYGYDMLGGLIFNTISQKVPSEGCLCAASKPAGGRRVLLTADSTE